jgi:ribose/xylose/arabinose/galactoside ABC-type transport system permease subunit
LAVLTVLRGIATTVAATAFVGSLNMNQPLAASATVILVGPPRLLVVMTAGTYLSIGSVVVLSGAMTSFFGSSA